MTTPAAFTLLVTPVVSWPRTVVPGRVYEVSVDLETANPAAPWPDGYEEFVFGCVLSGGRDLVIRSDSDTHLIVHRFGGAYAPVRFLVNARVDTTSASATLLLTFNTSLGVTTAPIELPVALGLPLHVDDIATLLSEAERATMAALLVPASQGVRARAYREVIRPANLDDLPDWSDATALVTHLERHGPRDATIAPPVIRFANAVAPELDQASEDTLRRWSAELLRAHFPDVPARSAEPTRAPFAQRPGWQRALILSFMLEPAAVRADAYHCSAWLEDSTGMVTMISRADDPQPLPELFERSIRVAPDIAEAADDVRIELIVPFALMSLTPDVPGPGIGQRYPLVLRSLDRIRNPGQWPEWRNRWRRLMARGDRFDITDVERIDPDRSGRELFQQLSISDRSVLLLDRPPSLDPEPLRLAISAGFPIIIWDLPPDRLPDAVNQLGTQLAVAARGSFGTGTVRARATPGASLMTGLAAITDRTCIIFDDPTRLPATAGSTLLLPPGPSGEEPPRR